MYDYLVSLYFDIVVDVRCFPRERFFGRHTIFNYKWLTGRFVNDLLYDFWASSYSITCIRLCFSRFTLELLDGTFKKSDSTYNELVVRNRRGRPRKT